MEFSQPLFSFEIDTKNHDVIFHKIPVAFNITKTSIDLFFGAGGQIKKQFPRNYNGVDNFHFLEDHVKIQYGLKTFVFHIHKPTNSFPHCKTFTKENLQLNPTLVPCSFLTSRKLRYSEIFKLIASHSFNHFSCLDFDTPLTRLLTPSAQIRHISAVTHRPDEKKTRRKEK